MTLSLLFRRGVRVGVHPSSASTENPVRKESCDVPFTNENSNSCPIRNAESSSPLVDIISPIINIASLFGIRLPLIPTRSTSTTSTPTSPNSNTVTSVNDNVTIHTSPTSNSVTTAPTSPVGNIKPTTPTKNVETPQGTPQEIPQEISTSSEEGPKNNPNVSNFY